MIKTDIIDWLKQEFSTVQLATSNETLSQIVDNTIRYWNTHSAFKYVKMYDFGDLTNDYDQLITADGTTTNFTLNTIYYPLLASTFVLQTEIEEVTVTVSDQSGGVLYGTYQNPGDITGTINYTTGKIIISFPAPPNEDATIRCHYHYQAMYTSSPGVPNSGGGMMVPIKNEFKMVTGIYPAVSPQLLWQDNTLWKMFGLTILDNVTSDLIMMTQAFQNYQIYVGTDFRWTWEPSEDPALDGKVFFTGNPYGNHRLCIVGAKRILPQEDIKSEHILDWVLYYAKALTKMCEGNMLRKADIINVRNDGQTLLDEGKQEKVDLEKRLSEEGRWLIMAKRF